MKQDHMPQLEVVPQLPENGRERVALSLGQSVRDRIGNTPLLRLDWLTAELPGVTLLGKAEWHNPGGSVKDRAAANIVADGRRSHRGPHRRSRTGDCVATKVFKDRKHRSKAQGDYSGVQISV